MLALVIDAKGVHYRELNAKIRAALSSNSVKRIVIKNVNGQRYIADGIDKKVRIDIYGVPGNDLAAFANGPTVVVYSNAQDAVANTMNDGKIVIHGDAGDVLGYGMRGGKLFIKGDVGYRVGIHMKAYENQVPVIIVGGCARDFFGEYMAGGVLILLGLNRRWNQPIVGNFCGTGMHGGKMYIRGKVKPYQLGREVRVKELSLQDKKELEKLLKEYARDFNLDYNEIVGGEFIKLEPSTVRPYGNLYCYE